MPVLLFFCAEEVARIVGCVYKLALLFWYYCAILNTDIPAVNAMFNIFHPKIVRYILDIPN